MEDIFSAPGQRSKAYLAALAALGGDPGEAALPEVPPQEVQPEPAPDAEPMTRQQVIAGHGPSAWGGPRHVRSNWRGC